MAELKMGELKMGELRWEWIANPQEMTCRNVNYGFIVYFQKYHGIFFGEIRDLPSELMVYWAEMPDGYDLIKKVIFEAELVFMEACKATQNLITMT